MFPGSRDNQMEELMNVPGLEGQSRGLTLWMVVRRGLERWRGPRGCCGRDRTRGLATLRLGGRKERVKEPRIGKGRQI
jgi:hypothetical protein